MRLTRTLSLAKHPNKTLFLGAPPWLLCFSPTTPCLSGRQCFHQFSWMIAHIMNIHCDVLVLPVCPARTCWFCPIMTSQKSFKKTFCVLIKALHRRPSACWRQFQQGCGLLSSDSGSSSKDGHRHLYWDTDTVIQLYRDTHCVYDTQWHTVCVGDTDELIQWHTLCVIHTIEMWLYRMSECKCCDCPCYWIWPTNPVKTEASNTSASLKSKWRSKQPCCIQHMDIFLYFQATFEENWRRASEI